MKMTQRPLVSIITVNRNNADGLRKTLTTSAAQSFDGFEHIVIDGASSDGSQAVVREFEHNLAFFSSEPDSGIYNAMNKGIARAKGQYLLFLNSGDHFKDSAALKGAASHLGREQLVYFDLEMVDAEGLSRRQTYPDLLDFGFFVRQSLPHPATFIDINVFAQHGPYDESLRIVSDWKAFMVWVCKHNCSYKHVPQILTVFYLDGLSSRPDSAPIWQVERERVIRHTFPAFYDSYLEGRGALQTLKDLRNNTVLRCLQKVRLLARF